jgi:hypothetical protein
LEAGRQRTDQLQAIVRLDHRDDHDTDFAAFALEHTRNDVQRGGAHDLVFDGIGNAEAFEHRGKVIAGRNVAKHECVRIEQGRIRRRDLSPVEVMEAFSLSLSTSYRWDQLSLSFVLVRYSVSPLSI